MSENLSKNLKTAAIATTTALCLTASTLQIVGSYTYQTPWALNAAIASKEFEHLKAKHHEDTMLTSTRAYQLITRFYKEGCKGKLIATPTKSKNQITGYTYYYYSPVNTKMFGYTFVGWQNKNSQKKKNMKKQWKKNGVLQDGEAVHQFVKDWKKKHDNIK